MMRRCDVVVVGGGPAGSTCAWALRRAGADVVLLDRARFPRDKPCAGWITPGVVEALELPLEDYRAGGAVVQPLRGFDISVLGSPSRRILCGRIAGYAIRRAEFDEWLLRRAGVEVREGTPLRTLDRDRNGWTINGQIRCAVVVGAGGHFCPVARRFRTPGARHVVLARAIEVRRPGGTSDPDAEIPCLYFCRDLEGYGWVMRKGDSVNIGFGRRIHAEFDGQVQAFAEHVARTLHLPEVRDARRWRGHAYMLGDAPHQPLADGVVLIGDAAGLARAQSGEGIGPAVQSALLAARVIQAAAGRYTADDLAPYGRGFTATDGAGWWRARVPAGIVRPLMSRPWFARLLVRHWFEPLPRRPTDAPATS